jgi:hypothetical protein
MVFPEFRGVGYARDRPWSNPLFPQNRNLRLAKLELGAPRALIIG